MVERLTAPDDDDVDGGGGGKSMGDCRFGVEVDCSPTGVADDEELSQFM